jgi:hypothetical protein
MKELRSKCRKDNKVDNNSIIMRTGDEDIPMPTKKAFHNKK